MRDRFLNGLAIPFIGVHLFNVHRIGNACQWAAGMVRVLWVYRKKMFWCNWGKQYMETANRKFLQTAWSCITWDWLSPQLIYDNWWWRNFPFPLHQKGKQRISIDSANKGWPRMLSTSKKSYVFCMFFSTLVLGFFVVISSFLVPS